MVGASSLTISGRPTAGDQRAVPSSVDEGVHAPRRSCGRPWGRPRALRGVRPRTQQPLLLVAQNGSLGPQSRASKGPPPSQSLTHRLAPHPRAGGASPPAGAHWWTLADRSACVSVRGLLLMPLTEEDEGNAERSTARDLPAARARSSILKAAAVPKNVCRRLSRAHQSNF